MSMHQQGGVEANIGPPGLACLLSVHDRSRWFSGLGFPPKEGPVLCSSSGCYPAKLCAHNASGAAQELPVTRKKSRKQREDEQVHSREANGFLVGALIMLVASSAAALYLANSLLAALVEGQICFKRSGCRYWSTDPWSMSGLIGLLVLLICFVGTLGWRSGGMLAGKSDEAIKAKNPKSSGSAKQAKPNASIEHVTRQAGHPPPVMSNVRR